MRIAFISDIHGNFTALEAVLKDIDQQNIDQLICLGDTVSLGPQPVEVLKALQDRHAITIMGNHDQAILEPEKAQDFEITSHLIPDLLWGCEQLSAENFEYIRNFQPNHKITLPNGIELLAYHGSPKSTTDLVLPTTSSELLQELYKEQTATVFIGGHTHIQMHRRHGELLFLNSGSVGNAFKFAYSPGNPPSLLPWAEYAIVEQDGDFLRSDMRRVYFEIDALLEIVKNSKLPGTDWWFRQYHRK